MQKDKHEFTVDGYGSGETDFLVRLSQDGIMQQLVIDTIIDPIVAVLASGDDGAVLTVAGHSDRVDTAGLSHIDRLAQEADAMFGARHYNTYHFLLTLSDRVAHFGLEHHQSNDSRVQENAVLTQSNALGVMAHEYVHSWNGKYRRPAGLATPDFQEPMAGDLLWV